MTDIEVPRVGDSVMWTDEDEGSIVTHGKIYKVTRNESLNSSDPLYTKVWIMCDDNVERYGFLKNFSLSRPVAPATPGFFD